MQVIGSNKAPLYEGMYRSYLDNNKPILIHIKRIDGDSIYYRCSHWSKAEGYTWVDINANWGSMFPIDFFSKYAKLCK